MSELFEAEAKPTEEDNPSFLDMTVRKKIGLPVEWEIFAWSLIGNCKEDWDRGDMLVSIGVPRRLKSGPRKGKKTWRGCETRKCVVSRVEVNQTAEAWERETGKCMDCYGTGNKWSGWSRENGDRFKPCKRCEATGSAPKQTEAAQ
jgi:hypothetical protein